MAQHHFIDPLFFLDAINEFGVFYDWFAMTGYDTEDMGRRIAQFDKQEIFGSLQPQTGSINFSTTGNTTSLKYKFYCMSKYRINYGDFIHYHERYLHVDEVQEYDEAGVREVSLTMVNLTDYRDFEDYLKYLTGEKTV